VQRSGAAQKGVDPLRFMIHSRGCPAEQWAHVRGGSPQPRTVL